MIRAFVVACAVGAVACGQVITVGGDCETRDDCAPGQSCIMQGPAGFCSKACAVEGTTTDCPGGTVCTFFGGTTLVCSTYCTGTESCRTNYQCGEVRGSAQSGVSACQPEGITR